MYNVQQLRTLREVHLRGTLAAAAEVLGHNPSTVSHQLTALQRQVGARLLEPTGRTIRLTSVALELVEHTERILFELEQAEAAVAAAHSGRSGLVRVAAFQTAFHAVLPEVVSDLRQSHPDLRLEVEHVEVEDALPGLIANDYDIVVQEEYPGHLVPRLAGIDLSKPIKDPMVFVTDAHPGSPAALEQASDATWVIEPTDSVAHRWVLSTCRAAGFEPNIAFRTPDLRLHLRLIADGAAVGIVPSLALSGVDLTGLRVRRLRSVDTRTIAVAQRRGSARSPALTAVRERLRTAIARTIRSSPGMPACDT